MFHCSQCYRTRSSETELVLSSSRLGVCARGRKEELDVRTEAEVSEKVLVVLDAVDEVNEGDIAHAF